MKELEVHIKLFHMLNVGMCMVLELIIREVIGESSVMICLCTDMKSLSLIDKISPERIERAVIS